MRWGASSLGFRVGPDDGGGCILSVGPGGYFKVGPPLGVGAPV